jgi:4'-phosphopantetheinyl transferase
MRPGGPVEVAPGVHVALAPAGAAPAATPPDGLPPWRAREYTAVRHLLRRLLAEVAGADAAQTPIAARPSGQPYLPERPDLAVSLSHSGNWVAAAVGVGPQVGVDVQVPLAATATLLRRCCGPRARAALTGMAQRDRDREFAWIWTVQEACVKTTGQGLAGLPWTVPVEVGQRAGSWHDVRWLALRDRSGVPVSCAYRTTGPRGAGDRRAEERSDEVGGSRRPRPSASGASGQPAQPRGPRW